MAKRTGWAVGLFIGAIFVAAAVNGVFSRSHAKPPNNAEAAEVKPHRIPACAEDQLAMRIEKVSDLALERPDLWGHPRPRDFGVAVRYRGGGLCRFPTGAARITISTKDGPGRGVVRLPSAMQGGDFADIYGPEGSVFSFTPFRYAPKCGERGPFVASVHLGPYVAYGTVPVYRCGGSPPRFGPS